MRLLQNILTVYLHTHLSAVAVLMVGLIGSACGAEPSDAQQADALVTPNRLVLANDDLQAEFDPNSGALVRLLAKQTNWQIQHREPLGRSFRLLVPIPGRRNHPIIGLQQPSPAIEHDATNHKITFTWQNLKSKHAGVLDIQFSASVALTDLGLSFTANLINHSDHVVENVWWPYLGEVSVPADAERVEALHMSYMMMIKNPVHPVFQSNAGYWGTDYPQQFIHTPRSPFVLIDSDAKKGLYMGYHDASVQQMVTFSLGLKPGHERTDFLFSGVAPDREQLSGQPVHRELSAIHHTYAAPGEQMSLGPIVVRPYQGTWHAGIDTYKQWRKAWYQTPKLPGWARKVHSWQQLHINSPEDDLRVRYRDLVQYGQDCAEHGVQAIQLTGWTVGGQDHGNPSHDVDPRLGSRDDLAWAIAEIQNLGVKMIMFNKFTWADRSTERFRSEWLKHAVRDPYGDYYLHPGYQYQTPAQFAHINTRRLIPMCHASAAWRDIAVREFKKSISLGADGVLYDENQHHGGARYCFSGTHGHHQPAHTFSGDLPLARMLHGTAAQKKPDFLIAGEGSYDLQTNDYGLCYIRTSKDHIPLHRYISPDTQIMTAIFGYNDRHQINQALMYRYLLSYEPRNYKGRLQEFPLTLAYGKRVDALRRRYADLLWNAEFRHTMEAEVTSGDQPYDHYSVFVDRASHRRAVVVINPAADTDVDVACALTAVTRLVSVTPEDPEPQVSDGRATVPALSAVVFMESR